MPTVKIGDRVQLKATPYTQQLDPCTSTPGIKLFDDETVFEVCEVKGSKVSIKPPEGKPFNWFKHTIKKVLPPDPSAEDIAEEEESVAEACGALSEPYRPSNSDQGYAFTSRWCETCEREAKEGSCTILTASLNGGAKEWIYDENDTPTCTAWTGRVSPSTSYNGESIEKSVQEESPSITCIIKPDGSRTAVITEQAPSKLYVGSNGVSVGYEEREADAADVPFRPKALCYPESSKTFSTPIVVYKGCEYWVEGTPPVGKNDIGEYFYCIRRHDGSEIASNKSYTSTTTVNIEARKAIDNLAAITEEEEF